MNNKKLRLIQKFGGTSIGGIKKLDNVFNIIKEYYKKYEIGLVVSAFNFTTKKNGTTSSLIKALSSAKDGEPYYEIINQLKEQHIALVNELLPQNYYKEQTLAQIDFLFSRLERVLQDVNTHKLSRRNHICGKIENEVAKIGENLSALIIAKLLTIRGIQAKEVDLSEIFKKNRYLSGDITFFKSVEEKLKNILLPLFDSGIVPVITGYMGEWTNGIISTIGRGYSDFTASLVASSVKAFECQIWKDVDGIYTADPKSVNNAKLLKEITIEEVSELTSLGAEVLHPYSLEQITRGNISLRIRNTFHPEREGTLIKPAANSFDNPSKAHAELIENFNKINQDINYEQKVRSLTSNSNVTLINLVSGQGMIDKSYLTNIFKIFENYNIFVKLINSSDMNLSLAVENREDMQELAKELENYGRVSLFEGYSTISLVGNGLKKENGITNRMLNCLSDCRIPIKMISEGASKLNISCVVESKYLNKALMALHNNFITC